MTNTIKICDLTIKFSKFTFHGKKIYEFERNIFLHSATDVSCKVSNGSAACSLYLASVK